MGKKDEGEAKKRGTVLSVGGSGSAQKENDRRYL
jgi:hypothetical protein